MLKLRFGPLTQCGNALYIYEKVWQQYAWILKDHLIILDLFRRLFDDIGISLRSPMFFFLTLFSLKLQVQSLYVSPKSDSWFFQDITKKQVYNKTSGEGLNRHRILCSC